MDDARVASALAQTLEIERAARATWETTADLPDKDAALIVMRHSVALRRSLESWIAKRALRVQLQRVRRQ